MRGWFERKTHRGKIWFVRGLVAELGWVPRHSFCVPRPMRVWQMGLGGVPRHSFWGLRPIRPNLLKSGF